MKTEKFELETFCSVMLFNSKAEACNFCKWLGLKVLDEYFDYQLYISGQEHSTDQDSVEKDDIQLYRAAKK